jgi:hypothetical protein
MRDTFGRRHEIKKCMHSMNIQTVMALPFPSSALHKVHTIKCYNLSLGRIMDDDNPDSDMVVQILNEVLAVVATSNIAVSCSVYMVPCYNDDGDDELVAHKVHSLTKCVDPESISSGLHAQLEMVLKERSLYSTFGVGNLGEVSRRA